MRKIRQENINIFTKGGPLTDDVINGVHECLENSFPHILGLQNVELGKDINFESIKGSPWIQVFPFY